MGRKKKSLLELSKNSFRIRISKLKNQKNKETCKNNRNVQKKPISYTANDALSIECSDSTSIEINSRADDKALANCETVQNKLLVEKAKTIKKSVKTLNDQFVNIRKQIKVNNDPDVTEYVQKIFQKATVEFDFPRVGVSTVLNKLNPFFPSLPSDYRSLLGTPRKTELRDVAPGKYLHLGIKENIVRIVNDLLTYSQYEDIVLDLDVFVDGVAFFAVSAEKSFWVILGRLNQFKNSIFPIGIYNGSSQPSSFNDLLEDFVDEIQVLIESGVNVNGNIFNIKIKNFCCDSPAKASLTYTVHPTGYRSCLYCEIVGTWFKGRVVFPGSDNKLRSDDDFKKKTDFRHHKGNSILESKLEVNMVSQFPLDYLHAVLLGAQKKLLKIWFQPSKPMLPNHSRSAVSKNLAMCNEFIPSEIHRKTRPMSEIMSYHGNELRVFLLKVGPAVLRNNIPSEMYQNYLLLHCAITILCDIDICLVRNFTAEDILKCFIEDTENIYGLEFVVSIIHSCEHLAKAVREQKSPLDAFSTFPFESFMTPIKNYLHTTRAPLPQIHRRVVEMMKASNIESLKQPVTKADFDYSKRMKIDGSFEFVSIGGMKISSCGSRDRFLLTNENKIVVCLKIVKEHNNLIVKCRQLKSLGDFYSTPIKSEKLKIFWCETSYQSSAIYLKFDEFSRKMFAVPYDCTSMVFTPLRKFFQ